MKIKVTLTLEQELWRPFRAACIMRGKSASSELEVLMQARLKQWERRKEEGAASREPHGEMSDAR